MRFRPHSKTPEPAVACEQEARLEDAEKRVDTLYDKTEWLRTVVVRRDQENHWQASVNRLFQGGSP
jgi:hypothetical protein